MKTLGIYGDMTNAMCESRLGKKNETLYREKINEKIG